METKNCPYCGEVILAVAKKCKHCGEWFDQQPAPVAAPKPAMDPKAEKEQYTRQVYWVIKRYIVDEGHSPALTRSYLMKQGYIDSPNDADELIYLCDQIRQGRSNGKKNILFGLIWCVGGLVVTVVSFLADMSGKHFIASRYFWYFTGAIVIGFIQFIVGLVSLIRANNRLINPF